MAWLAGSFRFRHVLISGEELVEDFKVLRRRRCVVEGLREHWLVCLTGYRSVGEAFPRLQTMGSDCWLGRVGWSRWRGCGVEMAQKAAAPRKCLCAARRFSKSAAWPRKSWPVQTYRAIWDGKRTNSGIIDYRMEGVCSTTTGELSQAHTIIIRRLALPQLLARRILLEESSKMWQRQRQSWRRPAWCRHRVFVGGRDQTVSLTYSSGLRACL